MFNKKSHIIFVLYFCLGIIVYPQSVKERLIETVRSELGTDVNITTTKFLIPKQLKQKIEKEAKQRFYSDYVYKINVTSSDSSAAFGLLDNVYGKSMPITFLVLFNRSGDIISTNVIKYREPYGGGVKLKSWNNQFKGKNSNSGFAISSDIESISGATISVRSLTKGIKKLTLLYEKIKYKK